jgi:hypothetical protein
MIVMAVFVKDIYVYDTPSLALWQVPSSTEQLNKINHKLSIIYHNLVKLERSQILLKNQDRAYPELINYYINIGNAEEIAVKEEIFRFLKSVDIKWFEYDNRYFPNQYMVQLVQKYRSCEYEKLKQFANS